MATSGSRPRRCSPSTRAAAAARCGRPTGRKGGRIQEGGLGVGRVAVSGEPLGPPRRITTESAHAPSWAGDSRRLLYQSIDKLRIVDIETGATETVPLDLTWTPAV